MMSKRLKQFVIGGAVLAALAIGSSASAGAAAGSSGSSLTLATLQGSSSVGSRASFTSTDASATAAHENTEKAAGDAAARATAAPPASGRGGSAGGMHHVRDSWIHDLYLTDHEQYVRHHQRLAS